MSKLDKNIEDYLSADDMAFFKELFNKSSIAFDSAKLEKERDGIKVVYKKPLKEIKEEDHFFNQSEGGNLFYKSYTMSLGKAASAELELADLKTAHYADIAKQLYAVRKKVNNLTAWQYTHRTEEDHLDEQIRLGNPLPQKYKWRVFGKRLKVTLKWLGRICLIRFLYDALVFPGKFEERRARRLKAKHATVVGYNANVSGPTGDPHKRTAKTNGLNLVECTRIGQVIQIKIGSESVSEGAGCVETEDTKRGDETPADTSANADTQAEDAQVATSSPDPPSDTAAVVLANAIVEAIDKIAGPPKTPRQKKLKRPPPGALRTKPESP